MNCFIVYECQFVDKMAYLIYDVMGKSLYVVFVMLIG
jgi:hypothetical protein